jgi:hypothetical protein
MHPLRPAIPAHDQANIVTEIRPRAGQAQGHAFDAAGLETMQKDENAHSSSPWNRASRSLHPNFSAGLMGSVQRHPTGLEIASAP